MSNRASRWQTLSGLVVVVATTTIVLTSCSGGPSSEGSSDAGDAGGIAEQALLDEPATAAERAGSAADEDSAVGPKPADPEISGVASFHIKTATIELTADDVAAVVDDIYLLAASSRGSVSGENTSTNDEGEIAHSRLEIKVPVAEFTQAKDEIESLGAGAAHTETSDVDVTGEVADVNSRVKSAEQSIDQLRVLFSQATKLGDIITLERELSDREAELEALQAQQRALEAQTTMSTILVTVTLVDDESAPAEGDDQAGFVAGIKQGWDGFVTFTIGASHALGLVLPLGTLLLILGWVAWIVVRRLGLVPSGRSGAGAHPTTTE